MSPPTMDDIRTAINKSQAEKRAHPLIWINGYPGVGKLSVATELVRLFKGGEALLIDNHSLIDPVAASFDRDDPQYYVERQKEREYAFERWILHNRGTHRVVIFTDCLSENERDREVSKEYLDVASKSNRLFVPVLLQCDYDEHMKRATSFNRRIPTKTKLTEPEILEKIREQEVMLTFGIPSELGLDVTKESPKEAASAIFRHVKELGRDPNAPTIGGIK